MRSRLLALSSVCHVRNHVVQLDGADLFQKLRRFVFSFFFFCRDGEKMAQVEAHAARGDDTLCVALRWNSCFYF